MRIERQRFTLIRAAVALVVGGVLLVPDASAAGPSQESDGDEERGSDSAVVDVDVDPMRAENADILYAFTDIRENILTQRAALDEAEAAVATAQTASTAAEGVVAETQAQIDVLVVQSDEVAVRAFVSPPSETALDALSAETAIDATLKQHVLDMQADADADVLGQLEDAQDRFEDEQRIEREAARSAEQAVEDAQLALADLESAVSQATRFTLAVEARLERDLGEIEALRESDPALADQLATRAAELAAQVAEAQRLADEEDALVRAGVAPADPGLNDTSGPITITIQGGLASVSCPEGLGSIQVAGVIARDLQGLLNLAAEQGVPICGNGWRDPAEQIALRRSHCGTSNYAIYQMAASSCSPPTARPGTSKHEQGLAVDFTCGSRGTVSWGDDCHDFLRANASDFGLYPLSGEPWHWSNDGN